MVFNSLKFAIFLPIVFAVFWLSPPRWRIAVLLLSSYIFYMAWKPIYLVLIIALTVINYWFGLKIHATGTRKKAWMIGAVTANLVALAYFKYFYFLENIFILLMKPWLQIDKLAINIVLPLGISFFVFEFIHYLVDVYRGSEPVRDFVKFALFPSFFPTQIAGPIKRFQDFVPQLGVDHVFSMAEFDAGVYLILQGLFKKVLLADNLALFVQGGFSNPENFTSLDMWLFAMAFEFQVYFDFGGYADIARGAAKLFGYKVPINFDFPFLSSSIADFWRRWHITLGTWLRDYLYIPLGGSRNGRLIAIRNLMITWALGGLWHGAEFHYIFWGLYQGLFLSLHREFKQFRLGKERVFGFLDTWAGHRFSIVVTFLVTTLGMAVFRAETSEADLLVVKKMCFLEGVVNESQSWCSLLNVNYPLVFPSIFLLLPAILLGQVLFNRARNSVPILTAPRYLKVAYGVVLLFAVTAFCPDNSPRFIYYQF